MLFLWIFFALTHLKHHLSVQYPLYPLNSQLVRKSMTLCCLLAGRWIAQVATIYSTV